MPYSDSGLIARIAPYAPEGSGAAAGAEDHPDAEGPLCCWALQQHCSGHTKGAFTPFTWVDF